jgi:hypothetical protein
MAIHKIGLQPAKVFGGIVKVSYKNRMECGASAPNDQACRAKQLIN